MRYNRAKAICLILWVAHELETPIVPLLWPVFYVAERWSISLFGKWIVGDNFVAMRQGPVPLQAFADLGQLAANWQHGTPRDRMDSWLRKLAREHGLEMIRAHFTPAEEQFISLAVGYAKQLGIQRMQDACKGNAWRSAGSDGLLLPAEIAKEAGAPPRVVACIERWSGEPYRMQVEAAA